MLKRDDILGIWALVSHETSVQSADVFADTGEAPWGSLVYLNRGFMSVSINWKKREGQTFLFYSGSFEFLEDDQAVLHKVKNSTETWRIGKDLKRQVSMDNSRLILSGEGAGGIARVVWELKTKF